MKIKRHYLTNGWVWLIWIWIIWQIGSVNWKETSKTDGLDNFYYQQRINQYPSALARFGYYTEKYIEPVIFVKIRSKLFDLVDLRRLVTPI